MLALAQLYAVSFVASGLTMLFNVAQISILPNVAPISENRACRRDTRLERLNGFSRRARTAAAPPVRAERRIQLAVSPKSF